MTTSRSPKRVLKQQAQQISAILKAAERGEKLVGMFAADKITAARTKENVTFGVAMDDKFLKITMRWTTIRETSEAGIAEYILKQMRESRNAIN